MWVGRGEKVVVGTNFQGGRGEVGSWRGGWTLGSGSIGRRRRFRGLNDVVVTIGFPIGFLVGGLWLWWEGTSCGGGTKCKGAW